MKFALEVHPSEIAYDIATAQRALESVDFHPAFGFNFDPSHLLWQGIDPAIFIDKFPDHIFHVHAKDVILRTNGERGVLGSHLPFGDNRRGWDFRSVGRGDVDFDAIIRGLEKPVDPDMRQAFVENYLLNPSDNLIEFTDLIDR